MYTLEAFTTEVKLASGYLLRRIDKPKAIDEASKKIDDLRDKCRIVKWDNRLLTPQVFDPKVTALLRNLSEREKNVICLRYGLFGFAPQTLEAVGNAHGVTRERVRQIESKAIATIADQIGRSNEQVRQYLYSLVKR